MWFEKDVFSLIIPTLASYARSLMKFTQQAINDNSEAGFDFGTFAVEPEIIKTGKINEVLSGKPNILVQILKEPIAAKGPRLSCEIFFPEGSWSLLHSMISLLYRRKISLCRRKKAFAENCRVHQV